MKSNDFDYVAFAYDRLANVVFGRSMVRSQKYFLKTINERDRVLILGGGTGWILNAIRPDAVVTYVEASKKMIERAKARNRDAQFILGTERDIPRQQFDVVISNFYLDLFRDDELVAALERIRQVLSPKSKWIATDFVNDRWWHRIFLKVMYVLFRVTTNIGTMRLPQWRQALRDAGGKKIESKFFYGRFIETTLFQF